MGILNSLITSRHASECRAIFKTLKRRDPEAVVVLITGYPHHTETLAAPSYGSAMLLRKPIKLSDIDAVQRIVFREWLPCLMRARVAEIPGLGSRPACSETGRDPFRAPGHPDMSQAAARKECRSCRRRS